MNTDLQDVGRWHVPDNGTKEVILKKVQTLLESHYDPDQNRFNLSVRWMPRRLLSIEPDRIKKVELSGPIEEYANFNVFFQSGQRQRHVQIQLAIDVKRRLPVVRRRVLSGSKLTRNDVGMQWTRAHLDENYVEDIEVLVGKTLRKTLVAGQAVPPKYIGGAYAIEAGDQVSLLLEKGGIRIEVSAEARESGAKNESIRVYSEETRRKYIGKVISEGVVKWTKTL